MRKTHIMGEYPFYNNNRIIQLISLILLIIITTTTQTTLAEASKCQLGCSNDAAGGILKYVAGQVYEYAVTSDLNVGLATGGTNNNAKNEGGISMKISAIAKLYADNNCAYTLQLTNVDVASSESESATKKQLTNLQHPVHFTMQHDGHVAPTLCIDANEDEHALNIKRAIISLLQNQIPDGSSDFHTETDIFGECATRSSQRASDKGGIILTKVRNLGACAKHAHLQTGLMAGGVLHGSSLAHGLSNLQADYFKEATINAAGLVEQVEATETYANAVQTQNGATSAKARVATSLKLKTPGVPATAPKAGQHETGLIFEAPNSSGETKNLAALKKSLNEVVSKINGVQVQQNAASHLVELIRLMRAADGATLLELSQTNGDLERKVYLDALFRVATAASAHAILKQLPKMSAKEQFLAVASLHLVKSVDQETLKAATALLSGNPPKGAHMAIGHLVNKYCQNHKVDCSSDVAEIAQQFAGSLKQCKAATVEDEERIIATLKGLGNMAHYVASNAAVTEALTQCLANAHGVAQRVRVASLQSVASVASCHDGLHKRALELFKDRHEDAELRIEAYLVAIECANDETAHAINEVLQDEPSYQVGGFVVSNLRVLRDSTDASRAQQRAHLLPIISLDTKTNSYPTNWHRYSFNHEVSYKLPALGMSASADVKMLYSQQPGFLPRATRLNVTSELYGNHVNILDLSVRQENMERILEYYLGPKGLLNKDFEQIVQSVSHNVRSRRSLATDAQKHAKKYKTYGQKQHGIKDINFDMSVKLFGSEIGFLSLGDNLPQTLDDLMHLLSTGFEAVKKDLQGFERQFHMHTLFLDSHLMYATSMGVPLEFTAQGVAASQFDMAAKLDIDALLSDNWQSAKYRVKFVPSIDATIQLSLGFHTPLMATGMRVSSKMHTATGSDIKMSFGHDGKSFKADIDLPQQRLELINLHASSDYYVSEADKAETKSIALDKSAGADDVPKADSICFNQLEDYTGFDFCIITNVMQMDWSNGEAANKWPLLQPLTLGIYVTAPPKLSLSAEKNTNEETGIRSLSLQYKTPGSAESHDTQLLFTLHCKEKNARVELNNPKLKLAAEMGLKNDARELLIYAQYEKDGKQQRSKIGFEKLTANEFKPVIELYNLMSGEVQHNVAGYEASGKLRLEPDLGRYNFEKFAISQNNGENQLVEVNGWAQLKNGAAKTDLKLTLANKRTYVIDSHANMPGSGAYDVGIFVHDDKQPDHVYGGSLNAKILPNDVSVNVVAKAAAYEIDLQNKAKYALKDEAQELKSLTAAHALKVQHKQQMVGAVHLTVDVESNKELKFSLDLERKPHHSSVNLQLQRNEGDFGVDFKANYNKHSVALAAKGAKLPDNGRTQVDGKFTSSWGTNGALQGQIGDSFAPQLIYINLNGHFGLSQEKPKHASLKVVGANDKTTADVGLKTDTEDLVKFNGEWQQHAGKMHMVLHQVLDTKADYKLAKNGKGEFNMQADLVDKAKKINVNGKFHIVPASKYDIDANVLYNDEQVLHVKSDNVVDKNKFSTASVVNMGEKKLALNAHATSKGEWRQNGELMANFDLTLPSGRRIDGEGKRKLTTNPKNGMVSGNAEWQVTDTNSEGKKHILSAKGKLEKLIPAQRLLINEAQWHYTNPDNQDMELKLKFKHVPKNNGQTHALDMQLQTAGSLLKNPMELNIKSDEYGQLAAKLEAHAKYGDKIDTKVSGAYDLSGYKSNKKPIDYEFKIEGKHGELQGKGKWQRPHAGQAGILQTTFEHKMGESESQLDFKAAGTQHKSSYDLSFKCNKMQAPLKVNGVIEVQPQQGLEISLNAVQGDKFLKTRLESKLLKAEADYELKFNLEQSESAALRDLEVQLKAHALNSHDYRLSVDAVHNKEHKYGMETLLHGGGSAQHGLEFYLSAPQLPQKMSIVALSQINADPQHAKLTLELAQVLGLDLKAAADAKYHDVEDFSLLVNWHSDKLSLKQYVLSIGTQEGKKLHVSLKNAEGTVLDGTASHVVKQHDAAKFIVEGQGELEYRGKSQQGNFRLIRQTYEVGTDKEMGVSYTLNGQVGTRQGVANLKLTNREFNVKLSVCEEKKPCTNLQLQSLVNLSDDDQSSKHSLLVLIDLRELGHPYEFELQSKTQRQGFKAQYSLDSSLVSHNSQRYQLIANLATSGAGRVLIKLPKRDILLELQQKIPANNAIMGNYEQSLTLWLDHVGQPQHMTKLSGSASLSGDSGIDAHGKLKLEHTGMRTLSGEAKLQANRAQQVLSAELNLDIFKQAEQQLSFTHKVQNLLAGETAAFNITAFSELKAPAYELNYHMGGHSAYQQHKYTSQMGMALNDLSASSLLIVSPEHAHFEIEALSDMLALLDASWSRTTNGGLESHAKLQILAQEPLDVETQVEATGAKISVKQGGAFDAGAAYKLGKELSVEVNGPKGEKYVNGRVSLEKANFLETTYTSDLEQLKEHLKLQYDTKAAMEKLSGKLDKLKNMVGKQRDNIVHALPDMQPLIDHVKSNLQQIVQELEADPMIKHLAQISRKIYEAIEKFVHKVSKDLDEFHRKLSEILRNMYKKAHDAMEQSILPVWKELAETAAKLSAKVRGEIVQVTAQVWENFMKFMEKYGPVLRNYALVVHDALKAIHERLESLHQMLQHEFDTISHEIKDMLAHFKMDKLEPLVEKLKEHWQHWKINEQLIDMFNQLFEQFNVLPQTEESNEFLTQLHSYLTAKLQHTETPTSLETLVQLALKAVRSLLAELAAHTNSPHLSHLMGWSPKGGHPPFMQLWTSGVNMLTKLPAILSMRFSLINLALNEPWAKHPLPWVSWYSWLHPFDLNAHLVNNAQYVSYDGVYGDFRADGANCKFILAQDSIDQNFTLVAHTQNQKLRSLTLLTHDGETLEIMDNGALKVNGQPAEYPHHGADLHAWHMHYTVWIRSQYGIEVACVTDLTLCHLTVNGFYAGRLRGMLGNANAEPFDDAQLPEGTVAVNNKDFVQAYNLAGKCVALESEAPVAVNNEAANDDICSELFGWHSALSAGFLMANAKPYREGCHAAIKGLEGDKSEELACHWALSYVTALRLHKIPVAVPSRCLKCQDKTLKHEQQIKLPGNKADIVFVVDVNVKPAVMEQLVAPVLGELREALKARSFSDIQIGVVAYNESQRYPALLTSNGGKLNYEGNLAEFKLDGGPTSTPCDGCFDHLITNSKILDILKHLQNAVQNVLPSSETQAFDLAFRYPFRAQATSTIVGVRGTPANSASLLHFLEAYAANKFKNFHKTILHVITPIEKMSVEGISDDKLIGFNSRLIATLDGKDAKKRSKLVLDNSKARSIDLVLNTGGWIFNTEHFESLKPQERKKALNQISSTIADTTFKTELITECTCDADYYALYAEPKCHVISTNFVANKKVKAKK